MHRIQEELGGTGTARSLNQPPQRGQALDARGEKPAFKVKVYGASRA